MPVFNFTAGRDLTEWQNMLARRNLHVCSSFDTVAFDFDGEMKLWQHLATMLPDNRVLDGLMNHRRREWQRLAQEAYLLMAHFLLEVAAYRESVATEAVAQEKQTEMQNKVRQAERHLHQQLLALYQFYHDEVHGEAGEIQALSQDPFDSELLLYYGVRTGKGVATGAAVGLGVDVLTAGLSLGVGTLLGSVIGGIVPNIQTISDKISGKHTLLIDAATLTVLAARAREVLSIVQARGHAAQDEIALKSGLAPWESHKLPDALQRARRHREWSAMNHGVKATQAAQERHSPAQHLAEKLKF